MALGSDAMREGVWVGIRGARGEVRERGCKERGMAPGWSSKLV